jgi:hypothetical protein
MEQKCYLCDGDLGSDARPFRIGMREEQVCGECYMKTMNRRKALEEEGKK